MIKKKKHGCHYVTWQTRDNFQEDVQQITRASNRGRTRTSYTRTTELLNLIYKITEPLRALSLVDLTN